MAELSLKNVKKTFGTTDVIMGVDLEVGAGEFCVFVGPSGCGKSTLLRLVAGLEDITAGELWIGGRRVDDLPPKERGIAMVFQSYALYPHMTVRQNMEFGLRLAGSTKESRDAKVDEAARILKIEELLDRKPRQLSGGQRQRVAIGRAIVREPRVFLFDEPLSNLDAALRVQTRIEIAKLHRQLGATMIYVTHDQVEAMTLADKIVVLNGGRVEQVGAPMELYREPANKFVAGFIGSPTMNFLPASVKSVETASMTLEVGSGAQVEVRRPDVDLQGHRLTLGLRPEHLGLADDGPLGGEAVAVEQMGGENFVHVDVGLDHPLIVKSPGEAKVRAGERVAVVVPPEAAYLFDDEERAIGRQRFLDRTPAMAD
jgi:multiple sugar transport system ATP-binding protein